MRAVDIAARLVARHLTLGQPPRALIATLGGALLREDACFHAYQMLEVGVRQFGVGQRQRVHPDRRRPLVSRFTLLSRNPNYGRAGCRDQGFRARRVIGPSSHCSNWHQSVSVCKNALRS
jgi:hypothetical protein